MARPGTFQKGQSGNPGGRPKAEAEVLAAAREASPAAISKLVELMAHEDPRVGLAAANSVLDRAIGKPTQATEISGPNGTPIQLQAHADELAALPADQRARVRTAIMAVLDGKGS